MPTVRKRLGGEPSTPGSCVPKRSGSKPTQTSRQPIRTAGRAITGKRFLMWHHARYHPVSRLELPVATHLLRSAGQPEI